MIISVWLLHIVLLFLRTDIAFRGKKKPTHLIRKTFFQLQIWGFRPRQVLFKESVSKWLLQQPTTRSSHIIAQTGGHISISGRRLLSQCSKNSLTQEAEGLAYAQ